MIVEFFETWQQIIIRAAIVVGFGSALVLLVVAGAVAGAVHWCRDRRPISEHTDAPEYEEAA